MKFMNTKKRDYINIICSKIKGRIYERGLHDKVGLITYDFEDISVVCICGGNIVFTIKVRHDETDGVIFCKSDSNRFDFSYYGIVNCAEIAEMYIDWEVL